MKVISEYKLTKEQIKKYRDKGYEIYYGYEDFTIKDGESVGFLLDTLYSSTMHLIESLLHRKHKSKITLKYKDQTYDISIPEHWKHTYYENHTYKSIIHPILEEYNSKREDYNHTRQLVRAKKGTQYILDYFDNKVPEDLDMLLNNFSRLYEVDYEDTLESKLRAYASIKYYLDNDIKYSRDILGIDPENECMFQEYTLFGDETYLDDVNYRGAL